jgi:ABC-type glycerol-3-phosphate transport system substrate-binding protein
VGTDDAPFQVEIEKSVADDFTNSHDYSKLVIEVVTNESARDILATEISARAGPDIVGPEGWVGANTFADQWLDLSPYIQSTG